jgi:hypothetical protein
MPDISMCVGTNCPHKETCYRFTAKPSDYQSYFIYPPVKDGKCEMYWGKNAESVWNQLKEIVEIADPTPPIVK